MSLKAHMQGVWRRERLRRFLDVMRPAPGCRILDVGGTPEIWGLISHGFDITLLNRGEALDVFPAEALRPYRVIEADFFDTPGLCGQFDLVFSNSVLEHVGSGRKQEAFAAAIRAASAYWVQVPAPSFPIEAHCGQLFWWSRPISARARRIKAWKRAGRHWTANQMATTRAITRGRLETLFPDALIDAEKSLGWDRSYLCYRRPQSGSVAGIG